MKLRFGTSSCKRVTSAPSQEMLLSLSARLCGSARIDRSSTSDAYCAAAAADDDRSPPSSIASPWQRDAVNSNQAPHLSWRPRLLDRPAAAAAAARAAVDSTQDCCESWFRPAENGDGAASAPTPVCWGGGGRAEGLPAAEWSGDEERQMRPRWGRKRKRARARNRYYIRCLPITYSYSTTSWGTFNMTTYYPFHCALQVVST